MPGARRSTGRATTRPAARVEGPQVGPASAIVGAAGLAVAGAGGQLYPEAFGAVIAPAYPDARTLCGLVARPAARSELRPPEPLYLRRPDAREPGPPKRVTPHEVAHRPMPARTGRPGGRLREMTETDMPRDHGAGAGAVPRGRVDAGDVRGGVRPAGLAPALPGGRGGGHADRVRGDDVHRRAAGRRGDAGRGSGPLGPGHRHRAADGAGRRGGPPRLHARCCSRCARTTPGRGGSTCGTASPRSAIRRGYYQPSGVDAVVMRKVLT